VPAPWQLRLDFFQLGCPALADGLSQDHEVTRLVARPTNVCDTPKIEGLRFALTPLFPALGGVAPEFYQARLLPV